MTIEQKVEALERKVAELTKETPKVQNVILKNGGFSFLWSDTNDRYEIVEWDHDYHHCWVIAFFDKASEGCDMRTVGARFTDADYDAFRLAQMAFDWLEENEGDDDDDNT